MLGICKKVQLKRQGRLPILEENDLMKILTVCISSTVLEQQFLTNVFAPINLTKAFLPSMRQRRSGIIFMIGSVAAYMHSPSIGLYQASKAALKSIYSLRLVF